ncbi:SchA/CurD-like domain-containing protein [Yinghuangia soli]|uniref:Antibiotic biosynthesis monooxygenase n=1 Tax=Yinghuangia soli TaxID=2908204 RepID=A0AA41Q3W2_9ACTN|nr:SchA/CurD-like domain-containing protein [Yinghuangia soli]MCF2531064.1 antibiotic biosynthesis monooxygenase [Yinghuangia soli]
MDTTVRIDSERVASDRSTDRAADRSDKQRPDAEGTKLRVLLMLEIHEGSQERFLTAYESIRDQVAQVPGHLRDQLCQSIEDPTQWLITSEWAGADEFLTWVNSPEHQDMVLPLHGCVRGTRSLRYSVARETGSHGPGTAAERPSPAPGARARSRASRSGAERPAEPEVVRCALSFEVKPGSEAEVARILSGYKSPDPHVDERTSLHRTSVFMRGNVVVRAVEIAGDMRAALQHVARQPQVRAAEEALNPHLAEPRDLDDPEGARAFFMRAALAEDFHQVSATPRDGVVRAAFLYPVRPGCADAAAQVLARHDEADLNDRNGLLAASSIYVRQDLLVRVVDVRSVPDPDPATLLGVDRDAVARLGRLLDVQGDLTDDAGLRLLHAASEMTPVTDRRAATAS